MSTTDLAILDDPCDGCGSCCRNQPYPPYTWIEGDMPPDDIREALHASILSGARDDDQPCLWLTAEGRCWRYADRPQICRDFRPGEPACNDMRAAIGLALLPLVPSLDDEDASSPPDEAANTRKT